MIKKAVCQVCNETEHKYRCPQCRLVYCSLGCYKTHKESCSTEQKTEIPNSSVITNSSVINPEVAVEHQAFQLDDDESMDRVSEDRLQALEQSPELREMLGNPHLRHMMTSLVQAPDPGSQLEKAMQEPIFTEFADQCLTIVENKENR